MTICAYPPLALSHARARSLSRSLSLHGVASIRLLKIIGLFCRIQFLLLGSFAKATYNLKEPTIQSHPIAVSKECELVCVLDYLFLSVLGGDGTVIISKKTGRFGCAVWCKLLQCVAVCCSVLQCVALCCIVLHCVALWCSVV